MVSNQPWGWGGWGWNWGARRAYYNHGYWGGWGGPIARLIHTIGAGQSYGRTGRDIAATGVIARADIVRRIILARVRSLVRELAGSSGNSTAAGASEHSSKTGYTSVNKTGSAYESGGPAKPIPKPNPSKPGNGNPPPKPGTPRPQPWSTVESRSRKAGQTFDSGTAVAAGTAADWNTVNAGPTENPTGQSRYS